MLADHQRNYLEIEVLLLLPPILSKPTINRTFCEVVVAQALPKVLFVYQKYARNLRQVGQFSLPLFYCLGLDIFSFTSDIGSNAQLGLMFGLSFVDYKFYRRFAWMAYLLIILLLIAVLLFGKNLQGGQRWLKIGPLQFQPSELAKFIIVICMAKYMTDHHEDMPSFVRGLLPMAALLVVPAVLIYFQPNVSMLIILCIVFAIMLFIGGASLSQLGIAALIGGAALVVLLFAASYRESRFTAWLDPWGNKSDAGYQIVQSLYAFGNGGWFGQGLDASRQKLLFLPYRESDFILSIIAEELGFVTVALLIAAYCFIIYRGIRIALSVRDRFASLVAAGFSSILAVQVAVNVAVVTNSIPATGQTLPFISSGGTSLVIFLAGIGVLLNISRYTEPRKSRGESYGKHKKQKQRQQ